MIVMLIGERPGLSVPDSLGIYLTYGPRVGRRDSERNCISNIHAAGLSYDAAAEKLAWLMTQARAARLTGVALKEDAPMLRGRVEADGREG
jgi:ethanolamine ammonia-lyase small subunit